MPAYPPGARTGEAPVAPALRIAAIRRVVAVGAPRTSSTRAPSAVNSAGAITARVSPRGRAHAAATLVAGLTRAPVGASVKGGA